MVTAPGGIVWTQTGSGLIHEEVPADLDRELHGLQIFVNLSSQNKIAPPKTFRLQNNDVPEWRNAAGNRVRVVVGSFEGTLSPLVPGEPFTYSFFQLCPHSSTRSNKSLSIKSK